MPCYLFGCFWQFAVYKSCKYSHSCTLPKKGANNADLNGVSQEQNLRDISEVQLNSDSMNQLCSGEFNFPLDGLGSLMRTQSPMISLRGHAWLGAKSRQALLTPSEPKVPTPCLLLENRRSGALPEKYNRQLHFHTS